MKITIVVQPRHVHLCEEDYRALFGEEEMSVLHELGHHGQFASEATVEVHGPKGYLDEVRVLGPCRAFTQVELSAADAFAIGVRAPLRVSGDLLRAGVCTLKGPAGSVRARSSTILPARHLHVSSKQARKLGLTHGDRIAVETTQTTPQRIEQVTVRVHPSFAPELHLTSDEAAQFWLHTGHQIVI